jgi:hypothetical protein
MNTHDGGKTWTEEELPIEIFETSVLYLTRKTDMLTVYDDINGITVMKRAGS